MPVQHGFNIGEGSPEIGRWSVKIKPNAPLALRDAALTSGLFFDTVCVTPTRLRDPGATRATVLSKAIFSGYIESATAGSVADPWTLSGPSLVAWLGTADNPSAGPIGFTSAGTVSLATFLTSLFGGGTPAGKYVNGLQLYSASTCSANSITDDAIGSETARQLIERWVRQTTDPTEWWVRPDGQAHFAVQGNSAIFTQTPSVMFGRDVETGRAGDYQCFRVEGDVTHSIRGWAGAVVVNDGTNNIEVNINNSWGTFDPALGMMTSGYMVDDTADGGGFAVWYRGNDGASAGQEAGHLWSHRHKNGFNVGAPTYATSYEDRRERALTTVSTDVPAHIKPGDYCYYYDPDTGAVDRNNEVLVGGRLVYPIKTRVAELSYPIAPHMGVYLISNSSGNALDGGSADYDTVTDLSDFVEFESGAVRISLNSSGPSVRRETHTFERAQKSASWR